VAMIYEYQKILQTLEPFGDKLHLMFSIGKDQERGSYSQNEMIEIIYKTELKQFASYSFHDVNSLWEMLMADAVVAGSACFSTEIAEKDIPCIIFDPKVAPMIRGHKKRVDTQKKLRDLIKEEIRNHQYKIDFADILMLLTKTGKRNG